MNINDIYSFILSCSLTDLEKRVKSDDFDGFATTLSFIIETRMSEATTDQFDKARFDRRKVSIWMVDSPTAAIKRG